jgi:hypothetical protein
MVVLPVEPRGPEDPPICDTCGGEVPDYRLDALDTIEERGEPEWEPDWEPELEELPENRVYTRKGLLQGLRDAAAERALAAAREFGERAGF